MGSQAVEERTFLLGKRTMIIGAGLLVGASAMGALVIIGGGSSAEPVNTGDTASDLVTGQASGVDASASVTTQTARESIVVTSAVTTDADEVVSLADAQAHIQSSLDVQQQGRGLMQRAAELAGHSEATEVEDTVAVEDTVEVQDTAEVVDTVEVEETVAVEDTVDVEETVAVEETIEVAVEDEIADADDLMEAVEAEETVEALEVIEPEPPAPTAAQLGAAAEALVSYDFRSALPGWTISYGGDRAGYQGLTNSQTKTIAVYIDAGDSPAQIAEVLMHEVGHAIDVEHFTNSTRQEWLQMRNMPMQWWAGNGLNDFAVGAGDFAEAVAAATVGAPSSSNYGGFTAAQLDFVRANLP